MIVKFLKPNQKTCLPPYDLINSNFQGNLWSLVTFNDAVKPVVKIVTGRTMIEKSKGGKSKESLPIKWPSSNENLSTDAKSEKDEKRDRKLSFSKTNLPEPKSLREPIQQEMSEL